MSETSSASQQCSPLWSLQLYSLGVPHIWAAWVLLLWWPDYCGQSGRCGWLLVQLSARPCLMQRLMGTGWQSWITRLLAVGPTGEWSQVVVGLRVPDLVSACWWMGPVPDMVCCRAQSYYWPASEWGISRL